MNTETQAAKIIELREILAQRFPAPPLLPGVSWSTGMAQLDAALEGGLWKGGMVELVGEQPSAGASSMVRGILREAARQGLWSGLIDGADGFDPHALEKEALARLLWVRCHTAGEAMQSADLLLRDGNLPLLLLDLRGNPAAELRRVPSQSWYRLQRMLEPTATAFLALTPLALIPCADARLLLRGDFSLQALEEEDALAHVELQVMRKRRAGGRPEEEPLLAQAV